MSESRKFGYCRVSTVQQNEDRQVAAMLEQGIEERSIIIDKISGKSFDREGYILLKTKMLRSGDELYIKELDRLGRNKELVKAELLGLRNMGVKVRVLDIPSTLCTFGEQEWVSDLVTNILVEVMGSLAEQERIKIKKRQAEGIKIAREKGKHLGRPFLPLPDDYFSVMLQVYEGKIKGIDAQNKLGLGRTNYFKLKKKYSEDFCRQQVEIYERNGG